MVGEKPRPIIIRKKIVRHAGGHGGTWKIAYADFATAMMSLFIVLWLMNSNAKVKQAVAGYFKDPAGRGKLSGTSMEGRDKTVLPQGVPEALLKPTPPGVPHGDMQPGPAGIPKAQGPKQDMEKLKSDLERAIQALPNFQSL